jgi:hypothetical protein
MLRLPDTNLPGKKRMPAQHPDLPLRRGSDGAKRPTSEAGMLNDINRMAIYIPPDERSLRPRRSAGRKFPQEVRFDV